MNQLWRSAAVPAAAVAALIVSIALVGAQDGPVATTDPPETAVSTSTAYPDCRPGETCVCPNPGQEGQPPYCDQDSDGDGYWDSEEQSVGSDPSNSSSIPEIWWYPKTCADGADNDIDGATDRDDGGCADPCDQSPPQPGDPPDMAPYYYCDADSDGDGYWDSDEQAVGSDPNNPSSTPEIWWYPVCDDGLDNDLDGFTDLDDESCAVFCGREGVDGEAPVAPLPDPCWVDSDGDGYGDDEELTSGSDPTDGWSTPEVWWYATCDDGADNDLDGAADGDDTGCQDQCSGPLPPVASGQSKPTAVGGQTQPGDPYCDEDSDGDGYLDSDELGTGSDPNDPASTPEVWWYATCDDALDNDLDGLTDGDDDMCGEFCVFPEPMPVNDGGVSPPVPCSFDRDGDSVDDSTEEWLGSDADDANSTPEHLKFPESCEDAHDNDGDGSIDSLDTGCQPDEDGDAVPDSTDNCRGMWNPDQADNDRDGIGDACEDNDGDRFTDLDESYLGSDPNDAASTPEVFWISSACEDAADNDGDGATDLEDIGCTFPAPLPPAADSDYQPLKGDADCDNAVDAFDALASLRNVAGILPLPPCSGFADVDCNMKVDSLDAIVILRHVARHSVTTPNGCDRIGAGVSAAQPARG